MATGMMEGKKPQDWINLILAVCLFLSPWIVGFTGVAYAAWNAWIVAVVLAVVAVAALSALQEWEEWVNLILGVWLFVAPWVLSFSGTTNALWTHLILGVLTFAVSAWGVWDYRQGTHAAA
jgi:hypothetical protein